MGSSSSCQGRLQRNSTNRSIHMCVWNGICAASHKKKPPQKRGGFNVMDLFAASVTCAHALIGRLGVVAIRAGFHLNAGQRTVVLILTVVVAAGNAATDVVVGLLLAHCFHLIKNGFAVSGEVYSARARSEYTRFVLRAQLRLQRFARSCGFNASSAARSCGSRSGSGVPELMLRPSSPATSTSGETPVPWIFFPEGV